MFPIATLSRPLPKGYVQCTACEHWCAVAPGQAGKCGVRRNLAGALRLVVYGRAIAAHIDPVEKKPLNHFLPGSTIFSIGTLGCNLSCRWCQIGKEAGLHYVYTGNVWGNRLLNGCSDTNCPRCHTKVIRRKGYVVRPLWQQPGVCPACGAQVAGVWE